VRDGITHRQSVTELHRQCVGITQIEREGITHRQSVTELHPQTERDGITQTVCRNFTTRECDEITIRQSATELHTPRDGITQTA